jgi:wyosine [tRNA(Phe)-imidazoG37] synthetase (radical SAM superfamily)
MVLSTKRTIIYGPVQSRRLGLSLGINLFPGDRKICSFDCLYCQYGRENPIDSVVPDSPGGKQPMLDSPQVVEALEESLELLRAKGEIPAYITFSGNGEATMHPQFPDMVEGVLTIRDRMLPGARVTILSNSSEAANPRVRQALRRLDLRIMKLDSGTQSMLESYNGVARAGLGIEELTDSLASLGDVTIQALFAGGIGGNLNEDHLSDWIRCIEAIDPGKVQIYTLARASATPGLLPASEQQLERIKSRLVALGLTTEVY